MKKAKNASQRKSYKGQEQGGGGSKKLHLQKQTDSAVGSGERMSGQHKHDNKSSVQNKEEVHLGQAADTSSSLQVGTQRKYSQESECKELMTDSIDTEFEMREIFDCTECRVILKEMIDTHKKKNYYIAKFGDHYYTHAVGCDQMYKGPSGEQKSDIHSHDVKRNTENQLASLPAEAASCHDRAEKNWEYGQNEMAEERSSAGENCQATGEVEDPLSTSNWWHGNKRRNEDNHSRERSDNQRGRQDGGNWGMQDRRKETDNYCRNAYGEGGRRRNMKYEDKGYKIVKEIDGDLFAAPKEWSLAHCVATDMRMGSGIAVTFRQNFKNVGALLEQGARVGHIAVLEHEGRYIYYLVTKRYSTEKPYFEDLVSSLEKMRDHCAENGVKNLAMPRIGCGLDRLEWRDVKPKVEEIFSGLDISITVYNFSQRWGTRARSRSISEGSYSLCHKNVPKKERKNKRSDKLQKGSHDIKKGKKKNKN